MKVTDLNGCPVEVTDLKQAISIARQYKGYRHEDRSFSDFDNRQGAYWTDMYNKLVELKELLKQQQMKTINITLYSFSELEKEAQEKATELFRDVNTDYNWWESKYDDFIGICSSIGIRTSPQEISFRGFYSQGDGSCFVSTIDTLEFIKGISEQAWKSYAPH